MLPARREGDVDASKSVIADTATLVGNSCFGKTIVDKDKHRSVVYVDEHAAPANTCLIPTLSHCRSLTRMDCTIFACAETGSLDPIASNVVRILLTHKWQCTKEVLHG